MNAPEHPDESWDRWSARLADSLGELTEEGWLTATTHATESTASTESTESTESTASTEPTASTKSTHGRERTPRTWRRLLGRGSPATPEPECDVPEAFLQARLLHGLIALECIADTEFEGLSDLTEDQVRRLVALGWEHSEDRPDLSRTFEPSETTAAAALLTASLRDVLRARTPADVDLRRSAS
ncbi:MAG: hypothetical protein L0H25_09800 [Micrococcales bacterium]|nr:hypothetical protein [Micrococcales bacterium]